MSAGLGITGARASAEPVAAGFPSPLDEGGLQDLYEFINPSIRTEKRGPTPAVIAAWKQRAIDEASSTLTKYELVVSPTAPVRLMSDDNARALLVVGLQVQSSATPSLGLDPTGSLIAVVFATEGDGDTVPDASSGVFSYLHGVLIKSIDLPTYQGYSMLEIKPTLEVPAWKDVKYEAATGSGGLNGPCGVLAVFTGYMGKETSLWISAIKDKKGTFAFRLKYSAYAVIYSGIAMGSAQLCYLSLYGSSSK